eukprot:IDg18794t1
MSSTGSCVLHLEFEDISSLMLIEGCKRKVWTVFAHEISPHEYGNIAIHLSYTPEKMCAHGEAETHMPYIVASAFRAMDPTQLSRKAVLQISKVSDNVCLAMLALAQGHFMNLKTFFVRIGHR